MALRENGTSGFEDAIYHMGKCLNDSDSQELVRNNATHFYQCKLEDGTPGVYINATSCVDSSRAGEIVDLFDIPPGARKTAAAEYLNKEVLVESTGIEDMGPIQWHLCLCLLAAWIVIFFCLIKGIKSSGKVVYFTATFPYFVLVILLIRAVTLPGASEGIKFYMVPDWSRLSSIEVYVCHTYLFVPSYLPRTHAPPILFLSGLGRSGRADFLLPLRGWRRVDHTGVLQQVPQQCPQVP